MKEYTLPTADELIHQQYQPEFLAMIRRVIREELIEAGIIPLAIHAPGQSHTTKEQQKS